MADGLTSEIDFCKAEKVSVLGGGEIGDSPLRIIFPQRLRSVTEEKFSVKVERYFFNILRY